MLILRYKNIISLFLASILMAPTVIKLEHHHEEFTCKAKYLNHFHPSHEKCLICSFEFSVFSPGKEFPKIEKSYFGKPNNILSPYSLPQGKQKYSSLFRAPPLFAIVS
jgi:hypothetical protein